MLLSQIEEKAREYGLSRLSKESGIARPHIHKIFSGKSSPSLRTLEKLLVILGCELSIKEEGKHFINLTDPEGLKFAMAYYGAPLILSKEAREEHEKSAIPNFNDVLLAALKKGRESAETNTVLPILIDKNIENLDLDSIINGSQDRRYLGYLLDLLYRLTSNGKYLMALSRLNINDGVLKPTPLIKRLPRNKFQKAFFEGANNPAAKTWKFQTGDSFESIRQRFIKWGLGDLHQTGA